MYQGISSVWTFPLLRLLQHNGYAQTISDATRPMYRLQPDLSQELQAWATKNRMSARRYDLDRNPVGRQDTAVIEQLDWEAVWLGLAPRLTSNSYTESAVRALQFVLRVKMGLPVAVDGVYKNATLHEVLQDISRINGAPVGEAGEVSSSLWRVILQADCELENLKSPSATPQDGYIPGASAVKGITVKKATYGGNCGEAEGNVNMPVAYECDGKPECKFRVDRGQLGFDTSDVVLRPSYLGKEMHRVNRPATPALPDGNGTDSTDNKTVVTRDCKLSLGLDIAWVKSNRQSFDAGFAEDIGSALGVEASKVRVLSVEAGSVIVKFGVTTPAAAKLLGDLPQIAAQGGLSFKTVGKAAGTPVNASKIEVGKTQEPAAGDPVTAKKDGDLFVLGPVCEQQPAVMACPTGIISIVKAQYGRSSIKACPMPGHMDDLKCNADDALDVVKAECEANPAANSRWTPQAS
jgi:hypothetical protein